MIDRDDYLSRDAVGLSALVRSGDVTAREVLETALALADEIDPKINALVVRDDERALEYAEHPIDGPLVGVPFLLKDLLAPMAGLRQTNGSRLWADFVPDHDSELVRRFKRAGLVIFGRTASPELGLTTSTESRLHGPTRNPWNLERSAGGSSGGSGSAVAAGIVPAAHGSDGGGSIRIPASCCGLFGLKPTRARVPKGPDAGEGWSGMSTDGVISRSVRDSAVLLDAISGPDLGAPYHAPPRERPYVEEVGQPTGRLRIAITSRAFNGVAVDPQCVEAVTAAADLCRELGHEPLEADVVVDVEAVAEATRTVVAGSTLASVEQRARELGRELDPSRDLETLTWATAASGRERSAADYASALRVLHGTGRQLAAFFQQYDLLLSPTLATPPPHLGALSLDQEDVSGYVEHLLQTIAFTQLMNVTGNPAMSVPLATSHEGLPIGIQVAAPFGDEATLFRLAGQLEAAAGWSQRRPSLS